MKAIVVHQIGGPEELKYEDVPVPAPGPGEVLIKVETTGVNYIDTYHRTGLYKLPLPFTPGSEAAGTVEAIGAGVSEFQKGDRVVSSSVKGAYAEFALIPAAQAVKIPEGLGFREAAAAMLQGMTAHYLAYSTWPLQNGQTALVHAAAGGMGLLLTQMAKNLGARVIGTVSTEEKAKLAREAGAEETILYTQQDFETEVKRIMGGKGVDVVYDSVGASTFMKSLNCLRPRGMMVTFGNASGPVPPIEPAILNTKGSLFLTRPKLYDYIATRSDLEWRANDVLGWVKSGKLKLRVEHVYKLAEAQQAHRDIESRKTTGKLILLPQ
jgi:NADPH2:quinone reductase